MSDPSLAENAALLVGGAANAALLSALTESAFGWPLFPLPIVPPFWVSAIVLVVALIAGKLFRRPREAADAEAKAKERADHAAFVRRREEEAERKAERAAKRAAKRKADRMMSAQISSTLNADVVLDAESAGAAAGADAGEARLQSAGRLPEQGSVGTNRPTTAHAAPAVQARAETGTRPAIGIGTTGNFLAACGVFLSAAQLLVSILGA